MARIFQSPVECQNAGSVASAHFLGGGEWGLDDGAEDHGVIQVPAPVSGVLPVGGTFQDEGTEGIGDAVRTGS